MAFARKGSHPRLDWNGQEVLDRKSMAKGPNIKMGGWVATCNVQRKSAIFPAKKAKTSPQEA